MTLRRLTVVLLCALTGLLLAAGPAMAARWVRVGAAGPQPGARTDLAAAASGSAVYRFGGQDANGDTRGDLWRLDVDRGRWTRLNPAGPRPAARSGNDLVAASDGTLLLFGGETTSRFFGDVWRFDPSANRWTRLSAGGPSPRYGSAAAVDPATGALVVTHGFTDSGRFDDTWRLGAGSAFTALTTDGGRPSRRCLVEGALLDGTLTIFGGQSDPDPYLGDLWRLNVATGAWRRVAVAGPRPSQRSRYAAVQQGSTWWLHGGDGPEGPRADLWRYDLRQGRFTAVKITGGGPAAQAGHALAALDDGRVVLVGTDGRAYVLRR